MIVVLVSNSAAETSVLAGQLMAVFPDCKCLQFTDPLLSAKYIWNNPADVVLAAEYMRPANGIELLKNIRSNHPELPMIIVAQDDSMQGRAKKLAADGYWLKPVTEKQLAEITDMLHLTKQGEK
jgi:DNA-binding NarL/FixJ family response regulator